MRVSVIAYTCLFLFAGSRTLAAPDWTAAAKKASESIVYVESETGSCTGFVIVADVKGDRDRILTAAHCDGPKLYADDVPAKIVLKDSKRDLMVLEVDDLQRPALAVAASNPKQGEEVGSFGYGNGLESPMFRSARVSIASVQVPGIEGGPFVMVDAAYVSGMSGGPVINAAGEVVSIVQRASGLVGIGVGAETIRDKIGRYLPKP